MFLKSLIQKFWVWFAKFTRVFTVFFLPFVRRINCSLSLQESFELKFDQIHIKNATPIKKSTLNIVQGHNVAFFVEKQPFLIKAQFRIVEVLSEIPMTRWLFWIVHGIPVTRRKCLCIMLST